MGKNLRDTVVANSFAFDQVPLPRAFHPKARSHGPITALGDLGGDGKKPESQELG